MKLPKKIYPHHMDENAFTQEEKDELRKLVSINGEVKI